MSSELDYLLERIPTNASKVKSPLPDGRVLVDSISKIIG